MKTISSQRYTDPRIVAEKIAADDYAVQYVMVDVDGVVYRVVIDGHHSLAAAKQIGADIVWEELSYAHELSQEARRDGAFFLDAHHQGDDYYDVETGRDVW